VKEEINMKKTIITVVGKDTVGIIAKVCTYLAENNINILDISQTIVQDYFNMMMIVDANTSVKPFVDMASELDKVGEEIGVKITCQHEDIFNKMHRI
jgi:ACT domain-containing protein